MQGLRRKIRDAADADEQLAAARQAGLSNRDWAARHGICGRSLHIWMVLRRRGAAAPLATRSAFVELVAPEITVRPIRIVVDGMVIEVPIGCPEDVLVTVIRAVRC